MTLCTACILQSKIVVRSFWTSSSHNQVTTTNGALGKNDVLTVLGNFDNALHHNNWAKKWTLLYWAVISLMFASCLCGIMGYCIVINEVFWHITQSFWLDVANDQDESDVCDAFVKFSGSFVTPNTTNEQKQYYSLLWRDRDDKDPESNVLKVYFPCCHQEFGFWLPVLASVWVVLVNAI